MTRSANFVEETTTSIAGTGGNGAVTLTAIASTPRFSTVFGTQATTVRYVIEDTAAKKFEVGIGSVASNVLTRTRPQVTWDGSTYTDNNPSALAFGSTPTSGDIRVSIAPLAESLAPVMARQTSISGDAWSQYLRSELGGTNGSGSNGSVITAGTEYYQAYKLKGSGRLTGIQIEVTTAVAASNFKWALYPIGHNGLPGAKIVDFVTTSSATTGIKTDTATGSWSPAGPIRLPAGWYAVGFIADAAIGFRVTGAPTSFAQPFGRPNTYGDSSVCSAVGNYTTGLPTSPAPTSILQANSTNIGTGAWIGLRVEA